MAKPPIRQLDGGGQPQGDTVAKVRRALARRTLAAADEQLRRRRIVVPGPTETSTDEAVVVHSDFLNVVGSPTSDYVEAEVTRDADRGVRIYSRPTWVPSTESVLFLDWHGGTNPWSSNNGVGGASYSTPGSAGHPGVWRVSSGASSGGYSTTYDSTGCMTLAAGLTWETLVYLSGDAVGAKVRIGLSDGVAVADPSNGVFFEYAKDIGANWRIRSGKAGVYTTTTSGTAVGFGAWKKLKITFNGTTIEFFLGGVSLGTITTNIPTAVMAQSYFATQATAGAYTSVDVDYTFLRQTGLAR